MPTHSQSPADADEPRKAEAESQRPVAHADRAEGCEESDPGGDGTGSPGRVEGSLPNERRCELSELRAKRIEALKADGERDCGQPHQQDVSDDGRRRRTACTGGNEPARGERPSDTDEEPQIDRQPDDPE